MSIEEHRRRLQGQIDEARARGAAAAADATTDADRVGDLLRTLAREDLEPALRREAIESLHAMSFHSATLAGRRADYVAGLRSAARAADRGLAAAAVERLAYMKDRGAQQMLLDGLQAPDRAVVAPEHALALLSLDPHAGAADVAGRLADGSPSEPVLLAALRVLASDPRATDRFARILTDRQRTIEARLIAATALRRLDAATLRSARAQLLGDPGLLSVAPPEPDPAALQLRAHIDALLAVGP